MLTNTDLNLQPGNHLQDSFAGFTAESMRKKMAALHDISMYAGEHEQSDLVNPATRDFAQRCGQNTKNDWVSYCVKQQLI